MIPAIANSRCGSYSRARSLIQMANQSTSGSIRQQKWVKYVDNE